MIPFRTIRMAWLGVACCSLVAYAAAPTRLDPLLDMVAADPVGAAAVGKMLGRGKAATGERLLSVLIKAADLPTARRAIVDAGGTVRSTMGAIVTAYVPATALRTLAADPAIVYIEADKPVSLKLNQSVAAVNGDDVNTTAGAAANSLPQAYTGSGVIVGVVDSGIDCTHSDFNDSNGSSRLLAYWDQTSGTTGVSEITGSSGTEYVSSTLASCSAAPDGDGEGHGSHVTGIATSSHSTYRGMAPAASIIAVKNAPTDASSGGNFATSVLDGVNYIFRKAAAQTPAMPAVVNLSLGTSIGAHDGTSLFEQGLDALLENGTADKQGRAIVNAVGNENFSSASTSASTFGGIHATINQTSGQNAYDFLIRNASILSSSSFGFVQVDVWLDAGSACTLQVDAFGSTSSKVTRAIDMNAVSPGDSTPASSNTDGHISIALNFTDSNNANNGKQHAVVTITRPSGATTAATSYSFDLIVLGTCTGDAWLYPDFTAYVDFRKADALSVTTNSRGYTYVSGDSARTATIPSTANKVIAVGSYMHAQTWTDVNESARNQSQVTGSTLNDISVFSSLGPTADARVKPDLVAPGEPIVSTMASTISSSVSSANKGDTTHHKLEGSSMAAPHVAGAVALMLQRDGCLTPTSIRSALLATTQTVDSFTGDSLPDNTWGYGKLDVLAAVQSITAATCAPSNSNESGAGTAAIEDSTTTTSDTTGADTETISGGGGSCSLVQ